ncbi:hypothetical protein ROZALSC1DRAFT_21691 [Rozella allomycis CSF55]|uniref:SET domain-containing protein n=1 Tax=Rozella allomycis (strain CSF55) TaxID=988480 RepID=A0A4P9YNB6_ROZAC|nr:hypothetical protein ROZALSC1DRAFT_21691 [Rozella allomycis CSF55]
MDDYLPRKNTVHMQMSLRELDKVVHIDNIKPQKMRTQCICPTTKRHGFCHYINGTKKYDEANVRFGRKLTLSENDKTKGYIEIGAKTNLNIGDELLLYYGSQHNLE